MKRWSIVALVALVGLALTAPVAMSASKKKGAKAKRARVSGVVVSVDAASETFVVKQKDGEVTVMYDAKAKVSARNKASLADVADGATINANGTFSEDGQTLTARTIVVLPNKVKPRKTKRAVMGPVAKSGDAMTVAVGDETITVATTEKTMVLTEGDATVGDLEPKCRVYVNGVDSEDGVQAQTILITSKAPKKKK